MFKLAISWKKLINYPTRWPSYCSSFVSSAMYLKKQKQWKVDGADESFSDWKAWNHSKLMEGKINDEKINEGQIKGEKNQLRRDQRWNLRFIWTTLLVFSSIAVWKIGQNTNHTSLVISFEQHLFKWPRDINCYLSWELAIDNLTLSLASILDWVGV